MRVLLLTPPMTQLNTPYPATAQLTGFLRSRGFDAVQEDPALELSLKLFSREAFSEILDLMRERVGELGSGKGKRSPPMPPSIRHLLENGDRILEVIDPTIRFLQGKDPSLAHRIASRELLPEGPRFAQLAEAQREREPSEDPLAWAFGALGLHDRAKYLASLFLDDLADIVRDGVDPRFRLSRYAERLAASSPVFDPLQEALESEEPTLVDEWLDGITDRILAKHAPDIVALSVPFPGNVYGAFRIARRVRKIRPQTKLLLGGGYVNTELRELAEPRVFDYVDFVTLDDGEKPILCILEHLKKDRPAEGLLRTFVRENGKVVFKATPLEHDIPHRETGTPTYDGLPLDRYLSILEVLNPMHRMWSEWRWNKLALAHGCYWKKCNFCDVNLYYIGRYDPASAELLVERIQALVRETGQSGFHFVDEAAPPALLLALSEQLIARQVTITWWANVRFDKAFTPELAKLMARAGCIAVSGGLEVASDRLLKLMNKGVTVEQVARVTRALADAGIMVHAYLMYGFPSQTVQETVDALDRVKQLFATGCIQSGYWHQFSTTAHSPIGRDPKKFSIRLLPEGPPKGRQRFARNDLPFEDSSGVDHASLGRGLDRALHAFMLGEGLDSDVRFWFEGRKLPRVKVDPRLIENAIQLIENSS